MRTYKEKGIFRFLRDLMVIWLLVLILVGVSLLFSFLSEREREGERASTARPWRTRPEEGVLRFRERSRRGLRCVCACFSLKFYRSIRLPSLADQKDLIRSRFRVFITLACFFFCSCVLVLIRGVCN